MNSSRLVLGSASQRALLTSTVARTALRAQRIGLSGARRPALRAGVRRGLPSEIPVLLMFQRYISTETSTDSGATPPPPPGFNAEQAKKPLPVDVKKQVESTGLKEEVPKDTKPSVEGTITGEGKVLVNKDDSFVEAKKEEKKKTLWEKVKHEAQHYWDGTKLLGTEIRISTRLALKMAAGYELTRREHRQLQRTIKDLGRLIPFSMFIIVPAGELFLPIALKIFPNLLPSTYEAEKDKEKRNSKLRETRKGVSEFLKSTLQESGLPVHTTTQQTEELAQFFRKIRKSGERPSHEEIIRVCKIFRDDLTLDNLSRPQLVAMCRYMNLNSFGTDTLLRYNVRHRMRQIKRDDKAISFEGIDSLTVPELQMACASRGIRTHGVSVGRLRDDLTTWLDLRLKHGVPSTLLVLSNAFMYASGKETELESYYDALVAVLSSIPEELYHEIELEVSSTEGQATNKQRLEVIKEQEELIKEEEEQQDGGRSVGHKEDRSIDEHEVETHHDEAKTVEAAMQAADTETLSRDANKSAHEQKGKKLE